MTTIVYGTSQPGVPELVNSPTIVRVYNAGQLSGLPAGTPAFYSSSGFFSSASFSADFRGVNGAGPQATAVQTVADYFSQMEDLAQQQYGCHYHEEDLKTSAAIAFAELTVMMTMVKPIVNGATGGPTGGPRTHPILFGPIYTFQLFQGGNYSRALVDTWTPTSGAGKVDFMGVDIYINLSLLTNGSDYCAARGLLFNVPELGTSVAYDPRDAPPPASPVPHLAHMQTFVTQNNGQTPVANPVLWFDTNHNILDTQLAAATSVGATTITVDEIPGKANANLWEMLSGYVITIDPHGAHPETVALTSTTSVTAHNPPFTLHVPALAFAHANNAVVWLMPQSVAYWTGPPPSPGGGGSFVINVSANVNTNPVYVRSVVAATKRAVEPLGRALRAAITPSIRKATATTVARRLSLTGVSSRATSSLIGRRSATATGATSTAVETPTVSTRAAVAARVAAITSTAGILVNTITRVQTVAVAEAATARISTAVAATRTAVETPTRLLRANLAARLATSPTTSAFLRAAVAARRTAVETTIARVTPSTTTFLSVSTAVETTIARLRANVSSTLPTVETTAAAARASAAARVSVALASGSNVRLTIQQFHTKLVGTTVVPRVTEQVAAVRAAATSTTSRVKAAAVAATNRAVEIPVLRTSSGVTMKIRAVGTLVGRAGAGVAHRLAQAATTVFGAITSTVGFGNQVPGEFILSVGDPAWSISVDDGPAWSLSA